MPRSPRLTGLQLVLTVTIAAIVATVVALAINSYYQYFLRVRIASGTAKLSAMRLSMERYFQKNLTYNNPAEPPCGSTGTSLAPLPSDPSFDYSCATLTTTQFTVVATGTGALTGFEYSIDQNDNRTTLKVPGAGWLGTGAHCWVLRKDGSC